MKTRVKPKLDEEIENRLDKEFARLFGQKLDHLTDRDWRSAREEMRLDILYRGEFVAHRDHYTGRGRNRRLALREVFCHSTELKEVQPFFRTIPEDEQHYYHLSYVDDVG